MKLLPPLFVIPNNPGVRPNAIAYVLKQNMSRFMTKHSKWLCTQWRHPPSLIRESQCVQWLAEDPMFLHTDSEDSDQTCQIPRLIWVILGRICHVVGFIMRRLINNSCFNFQWRSWFTYKSKRLENRCTTIGMKRTTTLKHKTAASISRIPKLIFISCFK